MIKSAQKKTIFLVSLLVSGWAGFIGSYLQYGYSKDNSLLIEKVYADVPPVVSGGAGGSCSGGDSSGCSGAGDSF